MFRGGSAGVCLTATVLVVVLVSASAPGTGAHASIADLAATGQIEPDTVLLDVSIGPNGGADWEIRYRVLLDDDNTTAAFESLERDIRENRSAFTSPFSDRIDRTVAAAENVTGREMAARNVSVRTTRQEIPQQYGLLVYAFEWTNFAATDGTRIIAGDAVGGLYLDESTALTLRWPSGYRAVETDPVPDETSERSATWRGPAEFTAEQPRLVVSSAAPPGDDGSGQGDDATGTGTQSLPFVAIGLAAVAVLVVVGWWYRRRPLSAGPPSTEPPSDAAPAPPEELLSNEERVLRLLAEHGGRMKQQQVVEELDWTDAKTSQVVGDLRESGAVEGFRLGRENVLRLPESDDEPPEP